MAVTDEMLEIALRHRPHAACLVPERREERTTEGGLEVAGQHNTLSPSSPALREAGVRVSLFIEASPSRSPPRRGGRAHGGRAFTPGLLRGRSRRAMRPGREALLAALRRALLTPPRAVSRSTPATGWITRRR
jgi:hypothetical protein